ncbi:protein S100-A6-like [Anarrhichthys ocellatus]|uniref:protein S100-A6-like n=1 Tax=Anarrhichthys ocellatus TaxID=433405 RepID=UPI0012ED079D|nr:protein S100-A6-like [Anarrhichthys ocellatus]
MANPGGLIAAIAILKATFDNYAGTDGDKTTLSKKEVGELLRAELGDELKDKKEFDKFFKGLDGDKDDVVSFEEFIVFAASFAMMVFGQQ